jgi:uncharacterized protein (DUF1330 family)
LGKNIMKKKFLLASILSACAAAVVTAMPTRAQVSGSQAPRAYFISEFKVTDPEGIRPYSTAVEATFKPFGGRFVVRGGKVVSVEGAPIDRVIMIAFPSRDLAQAWYASDAYGVIRPIRQRSAEARVYIMDALPE